MTARAGADEVGMGYARALTPLVAAGAALRALVPTATIAVRLPAEVFDPIAYAYGVPAGGTRVVWGDAVVLERGGPAAITSAAGAVDAIRTLTAHVREVFKAGNAVWGRGGHPVEVVRQWRRALAELRREIAR